MDASIAAPARRASSLTERPPSTSPLVCAARAELEAALDAQALGADLQRVTAALSSALQAARCSRDVYASIIDVRNDAAQLFHHARDTVTNARGAARHALRAQRATVHRLAAGDSDAALASIRGFDTRARSAAGRAQALSARFAPLVRRALAAAEGALAARDTHAARLDIAIRTAESMHAKRAQAWQSHSTVLQSLAECGKLHREARGEAQAAARKASAAALLSFVHAADRALGAACGVQVLAPVTQYLREVEGEAVEKEGVSDALLEAKRRQRELSRKALDEMENCSREIKIREKEIGTERGFVLDLKSAGREMRALAAVVMRLEHFWAALAMALGEVDAKDYLGLLEQVGSANGGLQIEAGLDQGENGWNPCAPVRRRHLQYFSKWAALEEVCDACVKQVNDAGRRAAETFKAERQAGDKAINDRGDSTTVSPTGSSDGGMNAVTEKRLRKRKSGKSKRKRNEVIDLTDDNIDGAEAGRAAAMKEHES